MVRAVMYRRPDANLERIAIYEASIERLEGIRADYVRRRPTYLKAFVALTLAGFACFAFGTLVGIWGSISATFVSLCGYAMHGIRVGELTTEIDALRGDVERLRSEGVD